MLIRRNILPLPDLLEAQVLAIRYGDKETRGLWDDACSNIMLSQ